MLQVPGGLTIFGVPVRSGTITAVPAAPTLDEREIGVEADTPLPAASGSFRRRLP